MSSSNCCEVTVSQRSKGSSRGKANSKKLAKAKDKAELAAQRKGITQGVRKRVYEGDEEERPRKKYSRKAYEDSEKPTTSNSTTKLSSRSVGKVYGTVGVGLTEIESDLEGSSARRVAKTNSRGRTIHLPQRYNV